MDLTAGLTASFLYGQKVADLAMKVLSVVEPEIKIRGLGYDTEIYKASEYNHKYDLMVIARTNAYLLELLLVMFRQGIPTHLSIAILITPSSYLIVW